jgi:protein XRP2
MGNCLKKKAKDQPAENPTASKDSESQAKSSSGAAKDGKKQFSWDKKKKANLADYQFKDQTDKFLFKTAGTLDGNAFRILKCDDCNIYVQDYHNQCTVDHVTNSVVVFGPQISSTFVRNCEDSQFVITCQQLRLRDCKNLQIMLYSQTEVSHS